MNRLFYNFLIFAVSLLSILLTACEEDNGVGEYTVVRLSVTLPPAYNTNDAKSATRVISSDNENSVNDLVVFIFDDKGDVIGSKYGSFSSSPIEIEARKATNCTVYVVANAGTTSGLGPFASVRTLSDFQALYATINSASKIGEGSSLLMFGSTTHFDTTSKGGSVSLARMVAKVTINIVVGNDITLDSYQLCHAPLWAYYFDNTPKVTVSPNSYGNFAEVRSSINGKATVTKDYYLFENLCGNGTNTNTDGWAGRNATNAPDNATYLLIKAHTATWKSVYRVYLGGKALSSDNDGAYDYTDYTLYRNADYTVTVNLNGSGSAEDGARVDYKAKVFFSGNKINAWGNDDSRPVTM